MVKSNTEFLSPTFENKIFELLNPKVSLWKFPGKTNSCTDFHLSFILSKQKTKTFGKKLRKKKNLIHKHLKSVF